MHGIVFSFVHAVIILAVSFFVLSYATKQEAQWLKTFGLVVRIVEACQAAGVLRPGPADVEAISIWSIVHGFISLLLEGQLFHSILERYTVRQLLIFSLARVILIELTPETYAKMESLERYIYPPVSTPA